MDTTFLTSVHLVVLEVVTLTLGLQVVTLSLRDVVSLLALWVETSVWELMLVHHTEQMVGIVTASITTMRCLQVLHLSELLVFHMVLDSVGFVAVVGLFLMDTVDKVVSLHTVVVAIVDKAEAITTSIMEGLIGKRVNRHPPSERCGKTKGCGGSGSCAASRQVQG